MSALDFTQVCVVHIWANSPVLTILRALLALLVKDPTVKFVLRGKIYIGFK